MSISRRLRFEILRRDGHTCRYCGATAPDAPLTVDHVIPQTLGGSDEPANLVTACQPCNAGKSSIAPDAAMVEDVDAASLLFAKAAAGAAEIRLAEIHDMESKLGDFYEDWWGYLSSDKYLPSDWATSIERFLTTGLVPSDLKRFLNVAMNARVQQSAVWRYFCGCCWREITTRQELARKLIEDGKV